MIELKRTITFPCFCCGYLHPTLNDELSRVYDPPQNRLYRTASFVFAMRGGGGQYSRAWLAGNLVTCPSQAWRKYHKPEPKIGHRNVCAHVSATCKCRQCDVLITVVSKSALHGNLHESQTLSAGPNPWVDHRWRRVSLRYEKMSPVSHGIDIDTTTGQPITMRHFGVYGTGHLCVLCDRCRHNLS